MILKCFEFLENKAFDAVVVVLNVVESSEDKKVIHGFNATESCFIQRTGSKPKFNEFVCSFI